MNLRLDHHPPCSSVLHLGGELTIFDVEAARQDLLGALGQVEGALEVEVSKVQKVDVAGLQLLLSLRRSRPEQIRFSGWSDELRVRLERLGLKSQLT